MDSLREWVARSSAFGAAGVSTNKHGNFDLKFKLEGHRAAPDVRRSTRLKASQPGGQLQALQGQRGRQGTKAVWRSSQRKLREDEGHLGSFTDRLQPQATGTAIMDLPSDPSLALS